MGMAGRACALEYCAMDTTRAWHALRLAALCCGCSEAAWAEPPPLLRGAEPALRSPAPARPAEPLPEGRFTFELDGQRHDELARLRGAFRIRLNDGASLALRPRGGGLVIAFRSQF
jgi:hypothetical protein